jgi:hypothetical protein
MIGNYPARPTLFSQAAGLSSSFMGASGTGMIAPSSACPPRGLISGRRRLNATGNVTLRRLRRCTSKGGDPLLSGNAHYGDAAGFRTIYFLDKPITGWSMTCQIVQSRVSVKIRKKTPAEAGARRITRSWRAARLPLCHHRAACGCPSRSARWLSACRQPSRRRSQGRTRQCVRWCQGASSIHLLRRQVE